jgi:STE24 endopeptidase
MRALLRLLALCGFTLAALLSLAPQNGGRLFTARVVFASQESPPRNAPEAQPNKQTNPPTRYTLSPEKRAQAIAYAHARYLIYFSSVALSLAVYFFLWRARISLAFRNWARRVSPRHFVQCLAFVPLFFGTVSLINFPLEYYSGFALERRFGLSTQSLGSWLEDWAKDLGITIVIGIFAVWILYMVIRRSPRRWWFYFWLISVPLSLGLVLIQPVIIDPLFFKFTPLEQTQPALTARIEAMLQHAGLDIPTSRIFEMNASTKTNELNAYVNGVGSSKRVVVWDTTLRRLNEDETLLVLGHETGHYVLGHVVKGFIYFEFGALVAFGLGFVIVEWMVKRYGARTGIEGVGDLAAFPILLLVLTVLSFLSTPIYCGVSRRVEHQADQFGLEVAYGVVPDPNAAEARSLQILGEEDLEEPDPSPFIKFWLYTHPPLDERIRFATSYKPWAEGKPLELVHAK